MADNDLLTAAKEALLTLELIANEFEAELNWQYGPDLVASTIRDLQEAINRRCL